MRKLLLKIIFISGILLSLGIQVMIAGDNGYSEKMVINLNGLNPLPDKYQYKTSINVEDFRGANEIRLIHEFILDKNMDVKITITHGDLGFSPFALCDPNIHPDVLELFNEERNILEIKEINKDSDINEIQFYSAIGKHHISFVSTDFEEYLASYPTELIVTISFVFYESDSQPSNISANRNYILSRTYQTEDGSRYLDQVQYFDGLGRPIEVVQRGITPSTADLVTYQEYDGFGRESASWLPVAISGNNGAFAELSAIKNKVTAIYPSEDKPYSLPVYEPSPLNRISKQIGPGKDWHTGSTDSAIGVGAEYLTNTSSGVTSCLLFTADNGKFVVVKPAGSYAPGELYVTKVTDEDKHVSYEFKDKQEQVVLTRQVCDGVNHDTYYVYDDFGNLRAVFPPMATDAIIKDVGQLAAGSHVRTQLAYLYMYDDRNRCIWKKLPGCDWIYYVYDKADRLIFSQDGQQRLKKTGTKSEWTFNKYDAFGRLIISGIYRTDASHAALEATYKDKLFTEVVGGGNFNYSWTTLSDVSVDDVLLINYYDDSENLLKTNNYYRTNLDYNPESGYGVRHTSAKGLLVGTRVKLINSDGKSANTVQGQIATAMYYDNRGRLIQTKSTNHLGGIESEYIAYNFTGQPTKKMHVHQATGKKTQTEYYTYEYDHAGRLLKTKHQLKDDAILKPEVVLAENTYDELGRLKSTTKAGQSKLRTDYAYNVRSWTKSIAGTLFSQTLYYNDVYLNNKVQYGGNISGIEWKHNTHAKQGYLFSYDDLSRLKTVSSTLDGKLDASHNARYEYDKHGNMTLLKRRGLNDNNTYTNLIDDLTLTYTGNKLKNIYDASPNVSLSASQDFKDYSKSKDVQEYFFNANGAMSKDLNKGISDIQYNSLNLPRQMDIKSEVAEARNEYLYSASGVKLQVKTRWNPNFSTTPVVGATINPSSLTESKTTDYAGNKIYEDGVLKRILIDGGYIENNVYHFYLTDHLGNNRVVAKADGTVVQRSDYYPFGMEFTENAEQGVQPYKYNGKELDTKHGLNMYDYSARYYESSIGRFSTVDPHAESYYSWSPYCYVGNNPLRFTDPTGMDWYEDDKGNVMWQDGDDKEVTRTYTGENGSITIKYKNVGQYYTSVTSDGKGLVHYDQFNVAGVTDLESDIGKKYSMLAAEGGWITRDGEQQRESQYGLYLIGASMENRLNNSEFFPNDGSFESLFSPKQYNAAAHSTYKNLPSKLSQWRSWYGTKDVMDYLNAVYNASVSNCVNTLTDQYGFVDANKILGYAHVTSKLFGPKSININYNNNNTLIKTLQTSGYIFP